MELAYANDLPSAVFDLLANVRVLFFDKSFIPMLEKEMKPGDKVWYFDDANQKIKSGRVRTVTHHWWGEWVEFRPGDVYNGKPGEKVFPTREALCEHYRKIFE